MDVCADRGWLGTTLAVINLVQGIMQVWVQNVAGDSTCVSGALCVGSACEAVHDEPDMRRCPWTDAVFMCAASSSSPPALLLDTDAPCARVDVCASA